MPAYIYMHLMPAGACRGQQVPSPLKLESQAVVSHLLWVLYEILPFSYFFISPKM